MFVTIRLKTKDCLKRNGYYRNQGVSELSRMEEGETSLQPVTMGLLNSTVQLSAYQFFSHEEMDMVTGKTHIVTEAK